MLPCSQIRRASVLLRHPNDGHKIKSWLCNFVLFSPSSNLYNQPQSRSSGQVSSTLFTDFRAPISLKSHNNKSQVSRAQRSSTDHIKGCYMYLSPSRCVLPKT